MLLSLREELEQRTGALTDEVFRHVLDMAVADRQQFGALSPEDLKEILENRPFPPNEERTARLTELRRGVLESMVMLVDIIRRYNLKV